MSKRVKLTNRTLEEINAEYAQLCTELGDALAKELIAKKQAEALYPRLYALNDEAIRAKKEQK